MIRIRSCLLTAVFLLIPPNWPIHAGDPALADRDIAETGKWKYNLFTPVPRELMRELSADRPDATESPYTVDAGHFQIEMSFATYAENDEGGEKTNSWAFGSMNLKAGLLNNVDIQFVFDAYAHERIKFDSGRTETVDGFSDLQVRLKINLWGNDGGRTAMAFFPFVGIPTAASFSGDQVEGGVILPLAVELTERIGLGFQAEIDAVYDEETDNYDVGFLHTAVIGVELTDRFGAYFEYVGMIGSGSFSEYQASLSGGFTFAVNDNMQLDIGTVVGLNETADDFEAFTGMTVRF